jgi:hypothetical protein
MGAVVKASVNTDSAAFLEQSVRMPTVIHRPYSPWSGGLCVVLTALISVLGFASFSDISSSWVTGPLFFYWLYHLRLWALERLRSVIVLHQGRIRHIGWRSRVASEIDLLKRFEVKITMFQDNFKAPWNCLRLELQILQDESSVKLTRPHGDLQKLITALAAAQRLQGDEDVAKELEAFPTDTFRTIQPGPALARHSGTKPASR